jgi:hypothetical protein
LKKINFLVGQRSIVTTAVQRQNLRQRRDYAAAITAAALLSTTVDLNLMSADI